MGTFLYEEISTENPFSDEVKEELQNKVIEILLEFGECAIEQINLYGKKIYVYDYKKLKKEEDLYILAYNRFENTAWEPSFMNASLEHFNGVRARGIGSKIGYGQHYIAMAVSRVLCECYSAGNYCVYGDIGTHTIMKCLAYLGKKYGFELVKNFIECRTNFEIMKNKEGYDCLFWGVRGRNFHIKRFQDMNYEKWKAYIEEDEEFKEDLINVERGEDVRYCATSVYLASLLVKCLCERELNDKLELNKKQLLVDLKKFLQKYYINAIEQLGEQWDEWERPIHKSEISQYSELRKYKLFFENIDLKDYCDVVCDKGLFCKSIRNIIDNAQRDDSEEIMAEVQRMIDEMVPSEEEVRNLQENKKAWSAYYIIKQEATQKKRNHELMQSIMEIAEKPDDISSNLISDCYLQELMICNRSAAPMSDELNAFLESIFSEERQAKFNETVSEAKKLSNDEGARKLLSMAEKLMEESYILFTSELFYQLLGKSFSETGEEILNKIDFYLKDLSETNQKEAFLWVLQDEKLSSKYHFW